MDPASPPKSDGSLEGGRRWSFGPVEFDERSWELRVRGAPVELDRKATEVLRLLLERAGEVVTKDELIERVWAGRVVAETTTAKCVSRIREVIGDTDQTVIKTLHGHGYRLVAPVQIAGAAPAAARPLRVLLIDDHELFRAGVRLLLADLAPALEFAEAGDCAAAFAQPGPFDVVLLDFHMPGLAGLDALRAVRARLEDAIIVVLSGEEDPAMIRRIVEAGAAGFIPKASTHPVMLAALRLVLAGGTYLPPNALLGATPAADSGPGLAALTSEQSAILRHALQGKSTGAIARELGLSEAAVAQALVECFQALGAKDRTEAVFAAARLVVQPPAG